MRVMGTASGREPLFLSTQRQETSLMVILLRFGAKPEVRVNRFAWQSSCSSGHGGRILPGGSVEVFHFDPRVIGPG